MRYIKIAAIVVLPFLFISLLWSQDLTEAAKKEKERREAAKGKRVVVVTNADLANTKKKAAVDVENPSAPAEPEAGQPETAEAQNPQAAEPPAENPEAANAAAQQEALNMAPPPDAAMPMSRVDTQKDQLEAKWLRAKEYADLLELKVNGLWQDFYSMDDMQPRDQIQQQLSDTFEKYQKARDDEAKAKEELDKYTGTKK